MATAGSHRFGPVTDRKRRITSPVKRLGAVGSDGALQILACQILRAPVAIAEFKVPLAESG